MDITIFTDLHYSSASLGLQSYFVSICKRLQEKEATMSVCMGDINTHGNMKDLRWLKEVFSQKHPFYYVLGNHDTWSISKKEIGEVMDCPRYYKVEKEQVTMLMLDSVMDENQGDYSGHMDEEQLAWLKAEMQLVPKDNILLIFSHHPLKNTVARSCLTNLYIEESEAIQEVIQTFKGTGIFFSGHNHMNDYVKKENWHYVGLGDVPDIMAYLCLHIDADGCRLRYHPLKIEHIEKLEHEIAHYRPLANAENDCYFENIEIEVHT